MKDFVKNQKVIKVGNSYAVTLDRKFIEENELQAGDQIIGSYSASHVAYAAPATKVLTLKDDGNLKYGKKLTKTEQRAVMHSKVTPEFMDWVDKSIEEDKEALEKLANL